MDWNGLLSQYDLSFQPGIHGVSTKMWVANHKIPQAHWVILRRTLALQNSYRVVGFDGVSSNQKGGE